jgi:osmotically-inducible protein OsmY
MRQTLNRYSSLGLRQTPRVGLILLTGVVVGAGLMYFLEPRTRARRQAIIRDKALSLAHRSMIVGGKLSRHLRNRVRGILAITADLVTADTLDSDAKIEARVRSALGRATHHAHSITVAVKEGRVSLKGPLAPHEAGVVIRATERVRGVKRVENLLTPPMAEGTSPVQ